MTKPSKGDASDLRGQIAVALCLLATMSAGIGFIVVYAVGGQTQVAALMLFIALGGLGAALVIWSQRLLPSPTAVEQRHPIGGDPRLHRALARELADQEGISRRRVLLGMLAGSVGILGAGFLVPLLSLGPDPGNSLFVTAWRRGSRLVGVDGEPIRAASIPPGGLLTVFPEGAGTIADADSVTVLLHIDPASLGAGDNAEGAADGYLAYSKLCTHVGCPVGLFLSDRNLLVCPCHQSMFDVANGAVPVSGPASRPLPRLPIQLQPDGTFIALGDFSGPVGPSFWSIHR